MPKIYIGSSLIIYRARRDPPVQSSEAIPAYHKRQGVSLSGAAGTPTRAHVQLWPHSRLQR